MSKHIPVLLQETISSLNLVPGMKVVDGTLGGGGHAVEIIRKISPNGVFVGIDADGEALLRNKSELKPITKDLSVQAHFLKENFRNIKKILADAGVGEVNAILLDLGFSSDQMEKSGRGFSHQKDEPLQMTLSGDSEFTALDIVNSWSEEEIYEILRDYGEEQFARQIAKEICTKRQTGAITTTTELVDVVKAATPSWYHHRKINPATKTFQAIRIAVNDELGALRDFLPQMPMVMSNGGRLAIISFHSLEDRIVKLQFVAWERSGVAKRVNKKAIRPERAEILANRRSRSAKLRVCEFI